MKTLMIKIKFIYKLLVVGGALLLFACSSGESESQAQRAGYQQMPCLPQVETTTTTVGSDTTATTAAAKGLNLISLLQGFLAGGGSSVGGIQCPPANSVPTSTTIAERMEKAEEAVRQGLTNLARSASLVCRNNSECAAGLLQPSLGSNEGGGLAASAPSTGRGIEGLLSQNNGLDKSQSPSVASAAPSGKRSSSSGGGGGGGASSGGGLLDAGSMSASANPNLATRSAGVPNAGDIATRTGFSRSGGKGKGGKGGSGAEDAFVNPFGLADAAQGSATGGMGSNLEYGDSASRGLAGGVMGTEDPLDYFSRLNPYSNLFKIVEEKYREKQVTWVKEDSK